MNGIGNQILALLKSQGMTLTTQVNIMALCMTVFQAESMGGGNQGAVNAVIAQAATIFPDPTFRSVAVGILRWIAPHVALTGDENLLNLAANLPTGTNEGIA